MHRVKNHLIPSLLLLAYLLTLPQRGYPQEEEQEKVPPNDIMTLQKSISAISAQQQQILAQLNELKKLLGGSGSARMGSQPPMPPSTLTTQDEAFRGNKGAAVAIVEYADFECPYCGQYERDVYPHIYTDYIETGKVKYFYRDLPLPMHPHALSAARAARCAGEQGKFWEMHDSLFTQQNALRDADSRAVLKNLILTRRSFPNALRATDTTMKSSKEWLKHRRLVSAVRPRSSSAPSARMGKSQN